MHDQPYSMRDPSAETTPVIRERLAPPSSLAGVTIGLLSISKERSDEFLDTIEQRLRQRGLSSRRFAKPTHTKPAPEAVLQDIIEHCDVAVIGLAD